MDTLKDYVKENYQKESTTVIGSKFGVNHQMVVRVMIQLSKKGEIDINQSFRKLQLKEQEGTKRSYCKRLIKSQPKIETKKISFNNHEGIGKKECRRMVSDLIGSTSSRTPKILTLPCDKWIWEKEVLKRKPESKFVGVEYDNDVFNRMVKTYVESPELQRSVIGLHNSPMSDIIRKSETDEYNHMILDYCGIINTFRNEIEEVLTRDLVKVGGVISITLSKSGRHNNDMGKEINNIMNIIPKGLFSETLSDCEHGTILSVFNMVLNQKGKYKLDECISYNDTTPMFLFIIRRML